MITWRDSERNTRALICCFDDIHILVGKEKTQKEFLGVFETLVAHGGRLALTSSMPHADIHVFFEAMQSKMIPRLMMSIKAPSQDDMELILSRRFSEAVPSVPRNLIRMALERGIGSDVRRARGIVNQLVFARCRDKGWAETVECE